jgi:hypothetical protein
VNYSYPTVSNNDVVGYGLLSIGIGVGARAWGTDGSVLDGGIVTGNRVSGAVVNLMVDGVANTTFGGNITQDPLGVPNPLGRYPCPDGLEATLCGVDWDHVQFAYFYQTDCNAPDPENNPHFEGCLP